MAVIDIKGLTKSYGRTRALDGIDLSVRQGEIYGFIGMNGAGKSTAVRIMLGMLRRDGGEISILGMEPFRDCARLHKRIAYVPGDVNLWPNLSGGEVIDLLTNMRGKRDSKRLAELTERFQFEPKKKCRSYSKGNRQKVALIAALTSEVELYIFDEPTSGLDPLMESVFQDCVRELSASGKTVFLSSHILAEVEKLCDRVSIIRDGRIVGAGSLPELQQLSRLLVTAECAKPIGNLDIRGVHDLQITEKTAKFSVDPFALSTVMGELAKCEAISLHCAPPELEDLFLHYYENGGGKE